MNNIWAKLRTWADDQTGASMIEYALLLIFIAIVAFLAIQVAGTQVSQVFSTVAQTLSN